MIEPGGQAMGVLLPGVTLAEGLRLGNPMSGRVELPRHAPRDGSLPGGIPEEVVDRPGIAQHLDGWICHLRDTHEGRLREGY
jgi:hypothetical protein